MWKKVSKDQIKSVPVGSKIHVCGVTTTLTSHYGEKDHGFDMEHEVKMKGWKYAHTIFSATDWDDNPTIEVWEEQREEEEISTSLEEDIKTLETKWNIKVEYSSSTIPTGEPFTMVSNYNGKPYNAMVVRIAPDKYMVIGLDNGNRFFGDVLEEVTVEFLHSNDYTFKSFIDNPFRA